MEAFKPDVDLIADNAIVWQDGRLFLIDQRALPQKEEYVGLDTPHLVAEAIRQMIVRGAPAIGITAAYGVVLAAQLRHKTSPGDWRKRVKEDMKLLEESRPTAVNLAWALSRMGRLVDELGEGDPVPALLAEARRIHAEDREANETMGRLGAALIDGPTDVLTHCNAGALATGGFGTALGVVRAAFAKGKIGRVYADETRPWMQGARLTAWELQQDTIPVTLLADSAAAWRMAQGGIGWVIVGADRIAANGDVANKIGTYSVAVAARHHGVKVMVAAPTSTIDMDMATGLDIPIEEREPEELRAFAGAPVAAPDVEVWNPVFDITPAALVDAIVTERGVVTQPDAGKIAKLMSGQTPADSG